MKIYKLSLLLIVGLLSTVYCDEDDCQNVNESNGVLTSSKCHPKSKRQTGGLAGGVNPISSQDEDVQLFLREALVEINKGEEPDYTVKSVSDATTQVVAGKLVKFKAILLFNNNEEVNCDFEVWEQAWIPDGRKVTVKCNNQKLYAFNQTPVNQREKNKTRTKREEPVDGAESPVQPFEDINVKLYLEEALAEINKGDDPDYTLTEVVKATTQVVAGQIYRIKANLILNDEKVVCDFEVWEQSWLPDGRQVKVNCDNSRLYSFKQTPLTQRPKNKHRSKRDTEPRAVGAPLEIDSTDKDVHELLKNHLHRLDTGSETPMKLVNVNKITRQVVAGVKYVIAGDFKAGSDEIKKCDVTIWHRAWIETPDGTQINALCDDGVRFKQRSKRSIRPMPGKHHNRHHELGFGNSQSAEEEFHAAEVKADVIFKQFQLKFKRHYANELEHKKRLRIFKKNLHKIDMLNKHEQGTAKYGITEFADMTEKEYMRRTGLVLRENRGNDLSNPTADIPDIEVPDEFDWVEKGVVTAVKNQGNCGSCWSFSVTGNIEGLHAVKTGKLEAYSEQELLDCDTTDNACNGGYMDDAYKAIEKIGGLELEDEYPYLAKKNKKCLFNSTKVHVKVKGAVDMPKGDEVAMQKYLVANGPISIGINAAAMQFYRGGISHPWKILCRKADLDHGVLLVGYGTKSYPMFNKTLPYWKIKNSWSAKWGEQGYYRIYRGDNSCGVAEMASSAVLE